jgi:REP element-mobilizing transposase RayT
MTTRARNLRDGVFGPLWQGRFRAKEVSDERYLMQLIGYVHLNPVTAGLSETADGYRWNGHRSAKRCLACAEQSSGKGEEMT